MIVEYTDASGQTAALAADMIASIYEAGAEAQDGGANAVIFLKHRIGKNADIGFATAKESAALLISRWKTAVGIATVH